MKYTLSSAFIAAMSVGAVAADLPSRVPAAAPALVIAPAYKWSGFYLGANAGYGWGHANFNIAPGGAVGRRSRPRRRDERRDTQDWN